MNFKENVNKTKRVIKFDLMDKLDLMNDRKQIKKLHILFLLLNYVYDNIGTYYSMLYSPFQTNLDKERIKSFEELLESMKITNILKEEKKIDLELVIANTDNLDMLFLIENGFLSD